MLLRHFCRRLLIIVSLTVGGCAALPVGNKSDVLPMKEPDAKFLKQVERDPFPRADAAPAARR
jgi:hypothetical protein